MIKKLSCLLLLIGTITLNAAQSINEQIEAIKHAKSQKRVELMNALKIQIASMNEEERSATLETLQNTMGGSGARNQSNFSQGNGGKGSSVMQFQNRNISSHSKH